MKLNWEIVFGGIAAVAGVIVVSRQNKQSQGNTTTVIPAIQTGALSGPTTSAYSQPDLTIPNLNNVTSIPASQPTPNYMTQNRGPNHSAQKAFWKQQAKNLATAKPQSCAGCQSNCNSCPAATQTAQGNIAIPSLAEQLSNLYTVNTNTTNISAYADASLI